MTSEPLVISYFIEKLARESPHVGGTLTLVLLRYLEANQGSSTASYNTYD